MSYGVYDTSPNSLAVLMITYISAAIKSQTLSRDAFFIRASSGRVCPDVGSVYSVFGEVPTSYATLRVPTLL